MIDTHCHLNFQAFNHTVRMIIDEALKAGITHIVVPGTDVETSKKAVELATASPRVYAAVGIHPHHVKFKDQSSKIKTIGEIERLLANTKVVAIGEVGLDNHVYANTKYGQYHLDPEFLSSQKILFGEQIQLAITYKKSLILHNREAADGFLKLLTINWDSHLAGRTVFHCCEPNDQLTAFAKTHHILIGVDGDVTYNTKKQEFIRKIPLEMLVVETDAPYLLPEPLRSQKKYPNTPANISYIVKMIAVLQGESTQTVAKQTTANAKQLFDLA